MADASIRIKVVDEASAAIRRIQGTVEGLAGPLKALTGLGLAGGLTAAVAGLRSMIGAMDDLTEAAEGLGVAANSLADLRAAAQQSGVTAQALDKGLGNLSVKLADAAAGNKEAVRLFTDLGVAFKDSEGNARDLVPVLRDIADRFATAQNNAQKLALAREAFGKGGQSFVAYLNAGSEGLTKFSGITAEAAAESKKLQGEIDKLTLSFGSLFQQLAGKTAGVINRLFDTSTATEIATLEQAIKGLEQAQLGDGKNLEIYRQRLAALKKELTDQSMQRFIANANLLRGTGVQLKSSAGANEPAVPRIGRDKGKQEFGVGASSEGRAGELEATVALIKQAEEAAARLDRLTGRDQTRKLQQDIAQLNKAFFDGVISATEYDEAIVRLTGSTADLQKQAEGTKAMADELGLVFESSLSKLITGGEFNARNFFTALAQDITQTIIKIQLLEPIIRSLKAALSSTGSEGNFFEVFFKTLGSSYAGARAGGGPVAGGSAYLVGERGPEIFVPGVSGMVVPNGGMGVTVQQNISIDARSDIATIRQAMVAARDAAVREVGNQLARRGALSRV